jgi:hypothetical protein
LPRLNGVHEVLEHPGVVLDRLGRLARVIVARGVEDVRHLRKAAKTRAHRRPVREVDVDGLDARTEVLRVAREPDDLPFRKRRQVFREAAPDDAPGARDQADVAPHVVSRRLQLPMPARTHEPCHDRRAAARRTAGVQRVSSRRTVLCTPDNLRPAASPLVQPARPLACLLLTGLLGSLRQGV